jgi:hypothetical protein
VRPATLAAHFRFRIVVEHDAEIRLLQLSRDQLVRTIRFSDRKPVRRQSLDVERFSAMSSRKLSMFRFSVQRT